MVGLSVHSRHFGMGLADLVYESQWSPTAGPAEYVNEPVGPGRTLACLAFAVLLVSSPGGPIG